MKNKQKIDTLVKYIYKDTIPSSTLFSKRVSLNSVNWDKIQKWFGWLS